MKSYEAGATIKAVLGPSFEQFANGLKARAEAANAGGNSSPGR